MCFSTGGSAGGLDFSSMLGGSSGSGAVSTGVGAVAPVSYGSSSAVTSGGGTNWLTLAPSIVSAVGKAASAGSAASGRAATASLAAQTANTNIGLVTQQEQSATAQESQQEANLYQSTSNLIGRQRAATAANGIALDSSSAQNVQDSTEFMRDQDLATLRNNAALQAFGYNVQKSNYAARAAASTAQANANSSGAAIGTSLLGSASDVASKWYDLYKTTN